MHTLTRMARGGIFDHLGGGFLPLRDRPRLGRAALREDALRQRRPARDLRRRAGHRAGPAADRRRRRHRGLAAARDAARGRRLLCVARRAARRRRGPLLHLAPRGGAHASSTPTATRSSRPSTASTSPRTSTGRWILHRPRRLARVVERLGSIGGGADAPARRCARAGRRTRTRPAPARREGARRLERPRHRRPRSAPPASARAALGRGGAPRRRPPANAAGPRRRAARARRRRTASAALLEDHVLVLEGCSSCSRPVARRRRALRADARRRPSPRTSRTACVGGFFQTAHDAATPIHRPKPWWTSPCPPASARRCPRRAKRSAAALFERPELRRRSATAEARPAGSAAALERATEVHGPALEPSPSAPRAGCGIIRGPGARWAASRARDGYQPRLCARAARRCSTPIRCCPAWCREAADPVDSRPVAWLASTAPARRRSPWSPPRPRGAPRRRQRRPWPAPRRWPPIARLRAGLAPRH